MSFISKLLGKSGSEKENTEITAVENFDDLELIAVITAAIAAKEGTTKEGFVVRSIKRRPSNHWR